MHGAPENDISLEEYRKEARKARYVAEMENQLRTVKFMEGVAYTQRDGKPFFARNLYELLEKEYRFHPVRKWRFDYALPVQMVALEMEGLTPSWEKSRHTTNNGYTEDCRKYSTAASLGWLVVRATAPMVTSGDALQLLLEAIAFRKHMS